MIEFKILKSDELGQGGSPQDPYRRFIVACTRGCPLVPIRPISKFLMFGILFLLGLAIFTYAQDAPRTVWDGVYNEEQAQRGRAVFLDQCSNCHGRDLEGADMTPALTGGAFMANWDGLTLGDLADRIRVSMPLNSPGTLSRQQTADVVAFILRFDQFPAGKEELPREVPALKQILFKARP
jgi:S-disulfanyl-L-cysteine oxidoreductase SoxD